MADVVQRLKLEVTADNKSRGVLSQLERDSASAFGTRMPRKGAKTSPGGIAGHAGLSALAIGGIAAAGVGLVAGLKSAISTAANFEQSMAKVRAITGASEDQFAKLTKAAKDLGATTQFSASEAASAIQFLGMAGLDTNEILGALPGTLNLAAAGALDLGTAADIATNVMSGMNLQVTDLNHIADGLAQAARSANTNVGELGQAFTFVAGQAQSAGLSFDETTAALGALANAGLKATRGGTNLASAITQILKPSKEAQETMEDLGLEFSNADGTLRPLVEIVEQMESVTLTAKDKIVLFGSEGSRAMNALGNMGSESLMKLQESIREAGGVAEDMAKIQMNTLQGSIKEFDSALESLQIELGTKFLPIVTEVMKATTEVIRNAFDPQTYMNVWNEFIGAFRPFANDVKGVWEDTTGFFVDTWHDANVLVREAIGDTEGAIEHKIERARESLERPPNIQPWKITLDDFDLRIQKTADFVPQAFDPSRTDDIIRRNAQDMIQPVVEEFKKLPEVAAPDPASWDYEGYVPPKGPLAKAVEGRFESAFEVALGSLVRSGDVKGALVEFGQTLADSIIGGLTSKLAKGLSSWIGGLVDQIAGGVGGGLTGAAVGGGASAGAAAVASGGGAAAAAGGGGAAAAGAGAAAAGAGGGGGSAAAGAGAAAAGGSFLAAAGMAFGPAALLQLGFSSGPNNDPVKAKTFEERVAQYAQREGISVEQATNLLRAAAQRRADLKRKMEQGLVPSPDEIRHGIVQGIQTDAANRFLPDDMRSFQQVDSWLNNNTGAALDMLAGGRDLAQIKGRISSDTNIPKFRFGGFGIVGGHGGPDSQLVQFMASPGERVDVTPSGGGGRTVNLNVTVNAIDTRSMKAAIESELGPMMVAYIRERSELGDEIMYSPGLVTPQTV